VRLSYRDLQEKSSHLALGLKQRGVKKGDRVAVSLGNNAEFAIVSIDQIFDGIFRCDFSQSIRVSMDYFVQRERLGRTVANFSL